MKTLLLFLLIFPGSGMLRAQSFSANTITDLSDYLYARQYTNDQLPSYGAIRKSTAQGNFSGQLFFKVEPYFSHIGAIGMLRGNHPDKCGYVQRWMTWYLNHLDGNGQTLNHYYSSAGTNETTCPPGATGLNCDNIDAEDSDPALFWMVARDYFQSSGDAAFFTPTVKTQLENAARFVIDSLIKPDHLSIAKRSYAIKYTMDNSEVCGGFFALSELELTVFNDPVKAAEYLDIAEAMQQAIRTILFNTSSQLYRPYLNGVTNPDSWYTSGVTATLWPQLFGVDAPNDSRSNFQRQVLNDHFDGSPNTDWTTEEFLTNVDGFTWAAIGYTFSKAGDSLRGFAQADYISDVFVSPFPYAPCYVADAGWAIMNMSLRHLMGNCNSLSIQETDDSKKLLIYPNPASDEFRIQLGTNETAEISLMDVTGKIFLKTSLSQLENNVNVQQLPNGCYLVNIHKNSGLKLQETLILCR